MKLTEIQIDCHGIWRNLTLPVRPQGLSVFYGPNEAGKTTLREFIGGVLFGFSRSREPSVKKAAERLPAAGSLLIEDESGSHRIHRASTGDSIADPCIVADDSARPAADVPGGYLKGVDSRLFERIFAIGLRELTEVSSLSGDDVAQHLFGLSLGPTGARILTASRRVDERRHRLIDPLLKDGELVRLFERQDELAARLGELGQLRERHAEWSLRRDQLEREIADLRKRHAGIAEQLRGHEFLERIWGPWDRIRDCRRELEGLPAITEFPERGLERLERLENEIAAAAESRDRLLAEVRQLRAERRPAGDDARWRAHASAMRGFVEQRDWLEGLSRRRAEAQLPSERREEEFTAECRRLGPDWSAARIERADISAAGHRRLSGTADSFLAALRRGKSIRRKCRRIAGAGRDLKESLAESLHDLNGRSIDDALAEARARVAGLNQQALLRLREVELARRVEGLVQHRERVAPQLALPRWVYIVLGIFAFMGVVLAGWGLIAGVATSGIAGAVYAMLGITCGGLAWGLKIQYEGEARGRLAEIDEDSAAAAAELVEVRNSLGETGGEPAGLDQSRRAGTPVNVPETSPADGCASTGPGASSARAPLPSGRGHSASESTLSLCGPASLLCQAQDQVASFVELAASQRRLRGMRRKLAGLRKKREIARREIATARSHWTELLAELGFPETLSVDEALAAWQLMVGAAERLAAWKQADHERQTISAIWEGYRQRMQELARRLPEGDSEVLEPLDVLAAWESQLATLDRRQSERRELRARLQVKQRDAREFNRRVEAVKVKRSALLVQGGAADRDEFEDRARSFARRTFLEDQMRDADADLDAACSDHGDLALVEADLERFDPRENSECLEMLRMERADLERDLERAFEHLGSVKREIEALEDDNQATKVRFELQEVDDEVRSRAREWAACEAAAASIDDIRREFERTHQPQALAESARLFARITRGKYRHVWAPLGERRLLIEDDRGRIFPVQSLSRGTREQLLLAVRLAVVRKLAGEGISLPAILDDVIVNFDEDRAAAAVELLLDLAAQGQQILFFTCHKHLAQLFAAHGIDPYWLPAPAAATAIGRDEQRLAG
jgi:uncharacterized protein YhaN